MEEPNLYAGALVLDGSGVLICGPSGSGKTALSLELVGMFRARRRFACLVSDDRVWIRAHAGRLVARAPAPIAGMVEIRGFGVAPVENEAQAVVDLVVRLREPGLAPRHRQDDVETLLGLDVPALDLAARDARASARAVSAWLGLV